MKYEDVVAGIYRVRKKMPSNQLRGHLEKCALTYGCQTGKKFFLGRYEAPFPNSKYFNASCLGDIMQKNDEIPNGQDRFIYTHT